MKLSKQKDLLVVAHPDDETLLFSGLLINNPGKIQVLCVTDGNADNKGPDRAKQFERACRKLGVISFEILNFPDKYETPLNLHQMQKKLANYKPHKNVYTHGPLGDYGHPHHRDVCLAVHNVFAKKYCVWSLAQNCWGEKVIRLTRNQYLKKMQILSEIYFSETARFLYLIGVTQAEHYTRFSLKEVLHWHTFFLHNTKMQTHKNFRFTPFKKFIPAMRSRLKKRPF